MYNETFLANTTATQDYLTGINDASGYLLFVIISILIFAVLFIGVAKRFGFSKGFAFASFISTFLTILLFGGGLIALSYVYAGVFMSVIGLFLLIFGGD